MGEGEVDEPNDDRKKDDEADYGDRPFAIRLRPAISKIGQPLGSERRREEVHFFNEDHQPICFSGSDRTETTTSETCSFVTFSSYAQLTRDLRKSTIADIQTWGQKRVYSLCC